MRHDPCHYVLVKKWYIVILIFFGILMVSFPGSSEEPQSPSDQHIEEKNKKKSNLLEELLDMRLPTTKKMGDLEISLNPRLDDTALQDHIRVPVRFKYGLTPNLELSCRLNNFLNNPFRDEGSEGISIVSLGSKYRWQKYLKAYLDSATAFSVQIPTDDCVDIGDGYTHYQPQLIFSRPIRKWRPLHFSVSIGLDLLSNYPERKIIHEQDANGVVIPCETPGYHSLGLTLGLLYPTPLYNSSLEFSWITTEIDGGTENAVFVTPGFLWPIPKRGHPGVPGNFRLALGVRFGLHDTDDDFVIIARINWDLPLKKRKGEFKRSE